MDKNTYEELFPIAEKATSEKSQVLVVATSPIKVADTTDFTLPVEDLNAPTIETSSAAIEQVWSTQAETDMNCIKDTAEQKSGVVYEELFPVGEDSAMKAASTSRLSPKRRSMFATSMQSSFRRSNSTSSAGSEFKRAGNAIDIILAIGSDGKLASTPWTAVFNWSMFRSSASSGVGTEIKVYIDGNVLASKATLMEKGRVVFENGQNVPDMESVKQCLMEKNSEVHAIRYEHHRTFERTVRYIDCRMYVWDANDSVVVVDLDGTLTISDVEGHIRTLRLGQYDYLHPGACDFYTKIRKLGCKIVYLTARPLDWAQASRKHLDSASQRQHTLPKGPLITNSRGITGALIAEVINKNPNVFKAQVLTNLQMAMIDAGRNCAHHVFVMGVGNRPTDTLAYSAVGMSTELILLIDPLSNLRPSTNAQVWQSYSDPNALLWILPRLKRVVDISKVHRLDELMVKELELADEVERMRLVTLQAQEAMQMENSTTSEYR